MLPVQNWPSQKCEFDYFGVPMKRAKHVNFNQYFDEPKKSLQDKTKVFGELAIIGAGAFMVWIGNTTSLYAPILIFDINYLPMLTNYEYHTFLNSYSRFNYKFMSYSYQMHGFSPWNNGDLVQKLRFLWVFEEPPQECEVLLIYCYLMSKSKNRVQMLSLCLNIPAFWHYCIKISF